MPGHNKIFAALGVSAVLAVLLLIDFRTGYHISMMPFYALPIFLAVWWVGSTAGILVALTSAVICYFMRPAMHDAPQLAEGVRLWNGTMRLLTYSYFWLGAVALRFQLETLRKRVKLLTGILPVCSCCKKIKDQNGYWSDFEIYLSEHSEADVSQKLCPDCSRKLSAGRIGARSGIVEQAAPVERQPIAGHAPAR